MCSIDAVSYQIGKVVRLECRASRGQVRDTKTSGLITPFQLEDMTGAIPGYFPATADKPTYPREPGSLVVVLAEIEERSGRPIARIHEMSRNPDNNRSTCKDIPNRGTGINLIG